MYSYYVDLQKITTSALIIGEQADFSLSRVRSYRGFVLEANLADMYYTVYGIERCGAHLGELLNSYTQIQTQLEGRSRSYVFSQLPKVISHTIADSAHAHEQLNIIGLKSRDSYRVFQFGFLSQTPKHF